MYQNPSYMCQQSIGAISSTTTSTAAIQYQYPVVTQQQQQQGANIQPIYTLNNENVVPSLVFHIDYTNDPSQQHINYTIEQQTLVNNPAPDQQTNMIYSNQQVEQQVNYVNFPMLDSQQQQYIPIDLTNSQNANFDYLPSLSQTGGRNFKNN